jgi:hypothetical protein
MSTPSPSESATPQSNLEGDLAAGTYVVNPLSSVGGDAVANESLTVTFTVPDGWQFRTNVIAQSPADAPHVGAPDGVSIQLIDVSRVIDRCTRTGGSVGPTVDDLVEAFQSQPFYEVSEPADVTLGGYSGKRIDLLGPTGLCDDGEYRFWLASALSINDEVFAEGPSIRWQLNILDVDGSRLVVAVSDFPDTAPADRAELDSIVDSIAINRATRSQSR